MKYRIGKSTVLIALTVAFSLVVNAAPECRAILLRPPLKEILQHADTRLGVETLGKEAIRRSTLANNEFPVDSLARDVANLVNEKRMVHQLDQRFIDANMVVPNGGLCLSTCAINTLKSVFVYSGRDAAKIDARPQDALRQLWAFFQAKYSTDITKGVGLEPMQQAIVDLSAKLGGPRLKGDLIRNTKLKNILESFPLKKDQLMIIGVVTPLGGGHALLVTSLDPKNKTITFIDPNRPTRVEKASIKIETIDGISKTTVDLDKNFYGVTGFKQAALRSGEILSGLLITVLDSRNSAKKPAIKNVVTDTNIEYVESNLIGKYATLEFFPTTYPNAPPSNNPSMTAIVTEIGGEGIWYRLINSNGEVDSRQYVLRTKMRSIKLQLPTVELNQDMVGKIITIEAARSGGVETYRSTVEVLEILDPTENLPNGAIKVLFPNKYRRDERIIATEFIRSIDLNNIP